MGKKSAKGYETELVAMIKARKPGEDFNIWLMPQVRATAANMAMIDKMQKELMDSDSLVFSTVGSTGQEKMEVSPLVALIDKAQRTLMLQLESLGLNYKVMPSKIDDPKSGNPKNDPLMELISDVKQQS